MPENWQKTAIY